MTKETHEEVCNIVRINLSIIRDDLYREAERNRKFINSCNDPHSKGYVIGRAEVYAEIQGVVNVLILDMLRWMHEADINKRNMKGDNDG